VAWDSCPEGDWTWLRYEVPNAMGVTASVIRLRKTTRAIFIEARGPSLRAITREYAILFQCDAMQRSLSLVGTGPVTRNRVASLGASLNALCRIRDSAIIIDERNLSSGELR
jgi:hypothetical protein